MSSPALLPTDVLVLGGGFAGCAAAALLARRGWSVTVLAASPSPPGATALTLPPGVLPMLDELGIAEEVRALPATQEVAGLRLMSADGACSAEMAFCEDETAGPQFGLQVERQELGGVLAALARREGAELLEGWRASIPLWEGSRLTGVVANNPSGLARQIPARAVLDATGRDAFLASRMGWGIGYPRHRRLAVGQQLARGVPPTSPEGAALTTLVAVPNGWWWLIPLANGQATASAILDARTFAVPPTAAQALAQAAQAPAVAELRAGWGEASDAWLDRQVSFRALRVAGDGYCLLGDAAGFFDPLPFFGVLTSLATAASAAQDIHDALARHGRVDAADFGPTITLMRRLQRLAFAVAKAFYDKSFLPFLYTPPRFGGLRAALVGLLAGQVMGSGVWGRTLRFRALRLLARAPSRRCLPGARFLLPPPCPSTQAKRP